MGNKTIGEILKDFRQTAEVVEYAPVVRGRWLGDWNPKKCVCSVCGENHGNYEYTALELEYNFCPYCGADMREVQNE